MDDYPKTLGELEACFGTEDACRAFLFQLRWPEGFVCSRSGAGKSNSVNELHASCRGI